MPFDSNNVFSKQDCERPEKSNPADSGETFPIEMLEERQKHFLGNFLRVVNGHAKGKNIAQQRVAKFLEKIHDGAFDLCRLRRRRSCGKSYRQYVVHGIHGVNRITPYGYILIPKLLFKVF